MTRLLLVASEFPPGPGGIGTHAHQLARYMNQQGWQVRVVTFQDYASEDEITAFNRSPGFEIKRWSRPKNRLVDIWTRWRRLQEAIRIWTPDILIATGDRQIWLTAGLQFIRSWASTQSPLPFCAIWHGSTPQHLLEKQFTRRAFEQADLTFAVSQYSLHQLHKLGTRPRHSVVITNGADEKVYSPDATAGRKLRQELGLEEALLLLTVGHVTERKGQDIVIRALPEILKSFPNVHYLIAGLPSARNTLEKLARNLGVDQHVHFLGRVDPDILPAIYNACDIFVLTSRHSSNGEFEGYGIVVAEAALCGKPSVVAGNSGLAEAVQDQCTGFVVPENDPASTANAIRKLLEDREVRQRMGEEARQRALAEQTWNVCMDRYHQAINQLVARTG